MSSAWKQPFYSQDPNKVKECLDSLGDGFTNHDIVEMARPEDHYMHGMFEWDDSVAAEKYRETQAGSIVRLLVHVDDETEEVTPVREYYHVNDEDKTYIPTRVIYANPDMHKRLLDQALCELRSFQVKYSSLSELSGIFDAIDALKTA